ncbi:MAG: LysR family transcriptional regulator [Lachnospiraceae bacterium]|nr:LysR family transcriptional regulator [Lachnospiraceae bacterium]
MSIRHLTIFLAVADCGTMSAAASHLYLSQPTVSQAIRELEQHYHGLLFERLGKKLYLTDLGQLLLAQARDLITRFTELEQQMLSQGQTATLKLGSTLTVGTCLTPSVILALEDAHPGLEVCSYVSNTAEIEQKLLRAELDAAIVEGAIQSPDLIALPIIDDCLVLAVGTRHPFYEKDCLFIHELNQQPFAMREKGSGTRWLFEEYAARHGLSIRIRWEANCPRAILNAVLYNKVLSVMSLRLMSHEIAHQKIRIFRSETEEWNRKFQLVYHKNKFLTPAIYELEKLLWQYEKVSFPAECGLLKADPVE